MAVPSGRMRLTIEVLALASENAHGPNRAAALADFKGRKFALPVQVDHTFEQVWKEIEERYKKNYLSQFQASNFTIKKLQDAYECDLDLRDTVGEIFEGETDPQKRMIKVVPSFVNRDFSMPPTSFLRPAHTQKRARESSVATASKRRRLEGEIDSIQEEIHRDQPVLSTESTRDGSVRARSNSRPVQSNEQENRSRSVDSLVFVMNAQTGEEEYRIPSIKREGSVELGPAPPQAAPPETNGGFKKPMLPASKTKQPPAKTVTTHPDSEDETEGGGHAPRNSGTSLRGTSPDAISENADIPMDMEPPLSPALHTHEETVRGSPASTPDPSEIHEPQESGPSRNVVREESEAPFLQQKFKPAPRVTYGARAKASSDISPFAKRAAQMLNGSRIQPTTLAAARRKTQTPDSSAETVKTTQTPQRKQTGTAKTKLVRSSDDTSTPMPKGKSTTNRGTRPTPNREAIQRVRSAGERINTESPIPADTIRDRTQTSSPFVETSMMQSPLIRRSSPKVVINVRSPPAQTEATIDDVSKVDGNLESTPQERVHVNQETPSHKVVASTNEQSTASRRTPIPFPANVRHLSMNGTPQPTETPTTKKRRVLKKAADITPSVPGTKKSKAKAVVGEAQVPSTNGNGTQNRPSPSRLTNSVSEILSSGSPPQNESIPASAPKRTPIPLPMNVRHLHVANKPPENKGSSPEESPASQYLSPVLTKRVTPASATVYDPPSKADKSPEIPKAGKQTKTSKSAGASNAKNGAASSSEEYSSTDSGPRQQNGKTRSKGVKVPGAQPTKELHRLVMKKMFPGGPEILRRRQDLTRKEFGKRPPDPVRDFESDFATDTNSETDVSPEFPSTLPGNDDADDITMESPSTHETNEYRNQSPDAANEQIMQEASGVSAAYASQSWGFAGLDSSNNNAEQSNDEATSKPNGQPQEASEHDENTESNENVNPPEESSVQQPDEDVASKSHDESHIELESGDTTETDNSIVDDEESKNGSPVQSARSSPDYSRRPARYLSHSPTPGETESENESASSGAENDATETKDNDDNDSTDSDSDTETDSDREEDTEMPDADEPAPPPPSTNHQQPSSSPRLPSQPNVLVPATQPPRLPSNSQPAPPSSANHTPIVPASQPTPSVFGSSQSVSQMAAARRSTYAKFPTLKQQLHAAKTSAPPTQRSKAFDPRTVSLGKLAAAKKQGRTFSVSDDSEDESSDSESSGDEPDGKKKGPLCSVA